MKQSACLEWLKGVRAEDLFVLKKSNLFKLCKSHLNCFFALITIKLYILLLLLYFCKPNENTVCIMDTLALSKSSSSVTEELVWHKGANPLSCSLKWVMPLRPCCAAFPHWEMRNSALEAFGSDQGSSQCETCNMNFQLHRYCACCHYNEPPFCFGEVVWSASKQGKLWCGTSPETNRC